MPEPEWHAPVSLEEALELRARLGEDAAVVAGGTFTGILVSQGLIQPAAFIFLGQVPGLREVAVKDGELRIGAMATHSEVEKSAAVRSGWPALTATFAEVASPRVRNQATVGGVLCDADYASDPPAMLAALNARVRLQSRAGEREVDAAEFITGHYQTQLRADELLVEVTVPATPGPSTYLKFKSRSSEDRPCVGVAAVAEMESDHRCRDLRVVVGAASERPQLLLDVCATARGQRMTDAVMTEIAHAYAQRVPTLSDVRGSSRYRTRVMEVCIRRALESLAA